jgi:hypothetical protein
MVRTSAQRSIKEYRLVSHVQSMKALVTLTALHLAVLRAQLLVVIQGALGMGMVGV